MSKDRDADIIFRILFPDAFSIVESSTFGTFTHNHDARGLALANAATDEVLQLVGSSRVFRNDGSLGSSSNGAVLSEEAGIASHHLDKEDAFVRSGCVANLVHAFRDGVQSGVIANRTVCAVQIVVDCSRQTDARHIIFLSEDASASQRAVAANDYKSINASLLHVLVGLLTTFRRLELLAASSLENRSTSLYDVAHVLCRELLDLVVDEPFVAAIDSHDAKTIGNSGSCHSTNGSIHSRSIATTGEDAYAVNFSHNIIYYLIICHLPFAITLQRYEKV